MMTSTKLTPYRTKEAFQKVLAASKKRIARRKARAAVVAAAVERGELPVLADPENMMEAMSRPRWDSWMQAAIKEIRQNEEPEHG